MTPPRRTLVRRGRRPLVGYLSQRNTLEVEELYDRTIVRVNFRTRALLLAGAVLFGPVFGMFFMFRPERFTRMPLFIQAVVVLTVAGMTLVALRTLFIQPTLELRLDAVVVTHPRLTIPHTTIREVAIETDIYSNPPRVYVENAVLVLRTADGDVRLAASPDRALIERLAEEIVK